MAAIAEIAYGLLPAVKVAVRVTHEAFDPEVEAAVEGAVADLKRVGIADACFDPESDFYPLVRQAVVVYCKAHFGQDNPNEEMRFWQSSYLQHVDALLNSGANSCSQSWEESEAELAETAEGERDEVG